NGLRAHRAKVSIDRTAGRRYGGHSRHAGCQGRPTNSGIRVVDDEQLRTPLHVKDARGKLVANHVQLQEIAPGKLCQGWLIPLALIRAEDKVNRAATANDLGNTQDTCTEVDTGRVDVVGLT